MKCSICKSEDLYILEENDMFYSVLCNGCGVYLDIAKTIMKPIGKSKGMGFKDVTKD